MSASAWLHPLTRASNILTVRLTKLERAMPEKEDALYAWPHWPEYVATADTLARLIQVTRGASWGEAEREAPRRRVGKAS